MAKQLIDDGCKVSPILQTYLTSTNTLRAHLKAKKYIRVDELLFSKHSLEVLHRPAGSLGCLRTNVPYFDNFAMRTTTRRYNDDVSKLQNKNAFSLRGLIHDKTCAICKCTIAEGSLCYARRVIAKCVRRGMRRKTAQIFKQYTFYICDEHCVEEAVKKLQNTSFTLIDFIFDKTHASKFRKKFMQIQLL